MSDLDKKLEEILDKDRTTYSDYICTMGDWNETEAREAIKQALIDELKPFIRAAPYKDEDFDSGWNNAIYAMQDQFSGEEETDDGR